MEALPSNTCFTRAEKTTREGMPVTILHPRLTATLDIMIPEAIKIKNANKSDRLLLSFQCHEIPIKNNDTYKDVEDRLQGLRIAAEKPKSKGFEL